jgi:DNA invertase Pin-like site-specific DNA recombinase
MEIRTVPVTRRRKLVDGTFREYQTTRFYIVKNGAGDMRANNGRPAKVTQEQKAKMREMYAQNATVNEIANEFNLSYTRVYTIVKKPIEPAGAGV